MKKESMIVLIAVICGVAAFVVGAQFLNRAASSSPKFRFVAAQRDIKEGARIEAADMVFSAPMESQKANLYFLQSQDAEGKIAAKDIQAGSLILRQDTREDLPQPAGAPAPAEATWTIPQGMKALTLGADMLNSIPMVLENGNYVDVIGSVPLYEGAAERSLQTIVRAAMVMAVERSDNKVRSVTLALNSDAVFAVTNAMSQSKLSLVARTGNLTDDEQTESTGVTEIIRGVDKDRKKTMQPPSGNGGHSTE